MQILSDACLALFAAIGIWALYRMILNSFSCSSEYGSVLTAVCVSGNGDEILHTVHNIRRRIYTQGILLVDCGLTQVGLDAVKEIMELENNVWFCSSNEVCTWEQGNRRWMNTAHTIK